MKAKLKDKRLLLTAVFFCVLAAMFLWPTEVKAADETGDFTVMGGVLDRDYSFSSGVLTVKTNTALTIKNTDPSKVTTNGIVVDQNVTGANITLSGVNIDHSPSFDIKAGASVNLTLSSDNTLHAIESSSDVGLNLASSAAVTINGEGSLLCGSGNSSAAAVSGGTVTVNGGTVMASAGPWSTGIQVGTLNIKGGTVQATGRGNPGIKGGTVNVSGGTLTANGGGSGAGINSDVTISGGTVTAIGGGEAGAGIGGNVGEAGKTVTISGGMVIATGGTGNGMGGAGIGGGYNGAGGTVNISGGTVVANAGYQSAGIGGGNGNNGGGGAVTITGGNVNTGVIGYGNDSSGGDFIITGGSINATFRGSTLKNGSGEGAQDVKSIGFVLKDSSGQPIPNTTIQSLSIGSYIGTDSTPDPSANPPTYGIKDVQTDDEGKFCFYLPASITDDTPVTVTVSGIDYEGKVGWPNNILKPFAGDIDLSQGSGNLFIWDDGYMRGNSANESAKKTYTGDYTLTGGTADTPTGNTVIVKDGYTGGDPAEGGKTITLNGVNISASTSFMIEANASVNLKLSGDNTLKGTYGAGLRVPVGAAVTIDGTAGTDSLTATGINGAMGIGGGYYAPCGKIIITGGSINATGTVGIGGWGGDSSQTIEITGGEIKANSIGSGQGGSATVTISGGTVTTNENISSSGLVTISGGTVNTKKITANTLTLTDGNVTAHNGIGGGTLNVSGGTLTASGENEKAAINSNTVTISGGSVTANGGSTAAGIGGNNGEAGKNVTISGGMVIATGGTGNGLSGAGIGGGNKEAGGKVTISGGKVVAKGGDYAAGIGGGRDGKGADVIITGGSVKASSIGGGGAYGGAGGGSLTDGKGNSVTLKTFTLQDSSGNSVNDAAIDDFTIPTYGIKDVRTDTEGKLYFYLPDSITDNTPVTVTAGGTDYVGKVNSSATLKPFVGDIDLSQGGNLYIWDDGYMRGNSADENAKKTYTGDYTLTGGTAESATANTVNVMGDYTGNPAGGTKKTITLNGVNIAASGCAFSIQANADVNLMLSGDNTLKSGSTSYAAGLGVPEGASVTIDSVPATGSLTATGGQYGAGIGGGTGAAGGTVTINGGTVNATAVISLPSSSGGAGIGSGSITWGSKDNAGGDITINGGSVTATGAGGAAGIGGGYARAGGAVTITGGSVVAKGDNNGAGIGTGDQYKGSDFGSVTISGGTVTATGSEYAAGIGGGYQVSGEAVKITGGSVKAAGGSGAEAIGHGYIGSGTLGSGTLTDGSGNNVYLNTLTVGENSQSPEIAVESEVTIDGATNYGTKDVTTMDGGKLYFYLPNNTTNPEIAVTHDGTAYSRNYQRNRASRSDTYTATLLPPPTYTITIPEKVDFGSLAYQPAGNSGQYNDKTFEVTPANLTNLTDGRSLSVMVSGSGTDGAFVMKTEGGGELPYSVYKDSAASGNQVPPGQALSAGWVNGSATAQSGTLRLDQTQIKYSGRYTGTLTFTVNVVDSK